MDYRMIDIRCVTFKQIHFVDPKTEARESSIPKVVDESTIKINTFSRKYKVNQVPSSKRLIKVSIRKKNTTLRLRGLFPPQRVLYLKLANSSGS